MKCEVRINQILLLKDSMLDYSLDISLQELHMTMNMRCNVALHWIPFVQSCMTCLPN